MRCVSVIALAGETHPTVATDAVHHISKRKLCHGEILVLLSRTAANLTALTSGYLITTVATDAVYIT